MDWRQTTTLTVEQAGKQLGLSRASAYSAASRGEIPVIKIGRRLLVPTARLRAMLGESPNGNEARAANADPVENLAGGDGQHETYQQR